MAGLTIIGSGRYLPGKPISNHDLARIMDTSDEWIRPRSGIVTRHYAVGETASDLGVKAAEQAIANAKVTREEIDYVIFCSFTGEYVYPGPASLFGAKFGIPGVPALDVRMQCAAIPFAMQLADGLVATNVAKTVLVIAAETQAPLLPFAWDVLLGESNRQISADEYEFATRHRATAVLFGDGAAAFVCRKAETPGHGLLASLTKSDGRYFDQVWVPGGGFSQRPYWKASVDSQVPHMKGKELFKSAVTFLSKAVRELAEQSDIRLEDVDMFVAHQANDRINSMLREMLRLDPDRVPSNIARYGNTSAATIPILYDELAREGRIRSGSLVCFLALGAGLHWGVTLMRIE